MSMISGLKLAFICHDLYFTQVKDVVRFKFLINDRPIYEKWEFGEVGTNVAHMK